MKDDRAVVSGVKEGARIYNLFPRIAGGIDRWSIHIKRAEWMGFNWVYINPFHPTGKSSASLARFTASMVCKAWNPS